MSIAPFIRCSDIKASLDFYTNILDFSIVQAPDPDPESFMSMYAFLSRDGSGVHLSQHTGDGVFGSVIYVELNNIDEIHRTFLGNGLTAQTTAGLSMDLVEQTWGMKEFAVTDPDGNKIRFGQRIA